jgi:4-hydroxybenzoate polyprenyltransferase
MANPIKDYLSLVKFSHTIFAMPFAVIGFMLGVSQPGQKFDGLLFLKVLLCMIFARTAAMAFNRWADRHYDVKNERTKVREIPSGVISAKSAATLVILSSVAFIGTTWFINPLCFALSPIALIVVLGYSYTKRFTWLCHLVLGIGLSLAPIGAYLAVTGVFDWVPILFSMTVLTWVTGFDIIYALQDEEFDKSLDLYSMPSIFGKKKALKTSIFFHLMSIAFLAIAGSMANFGFTYWAGFVIFSALLIYQHTLVKSNDLSKVNIAFFTTNGIASLVFAAFVVTELIIQ